MHKLFHSSYLFVCIKDQIILQFALFHFYLLVFIKDYFNLPVECKAILTPSASYCNKSILFCVHSKI